jgi:hypothetical protein
MASRTRRIAACAALVLLSSAAAHAQNAPSTGATATELSADERARELYLRGDRLYAEGNYDGAISAWRDAYTLSQRPALLYDLANALERLGRYEEALHYLNLYAPNAPDHQRHIVLKRIHALEGRAEEQRKQEGGGAPPSAGRQPGARAETPVQQQRAGGLDLQGLQRQPTTDQPGANQLGTRQPSSQQPGPQQLGSRQLSSQQPGAVQPDSEQPREQPWLGYAVGGAGVISLAVGTVFGVSASSAREDAKGQCVDNTRTVLCPVAARSNLSDRRSQAIAADILWGVGIAALGVGVYLVVDTSTGSTTELRSAASPSGGSMSLVHTF